MKRLSLRWCVDRLWEAAAFAAAVTLAVIAISLAVPVGGCAVGYPVRADGTADTTQPIAGIKMPSDPPSAAGLGLLAGALTGNPAIAAGVTALGGGLLAAWQRSQGRHKGWQEREEAATVQAPLPKEGA